MSFSVSCATCNCSKTNESRCALGYSAASSVINSGLSPPAFERGSEGKRRSFVFVFYSLSHYAAVWMSPCPYSQQAEQNCWALTTATEINRNCRDIVTLRNSLSFFRSLIIERLILELHKKFSVPVNFFQFRFISGGQDQAHCVRQTKSQGMVRRKKEDPSRRSAEFRSILESLCAQGQQVHNQQGILRATHNWTLQMNRPSWGSHEKNPSFIYVCVLHAFA